MSPEGLGEQSQRGLLGELLFLKVFLIPLLGPARAVSSWQGPSKATHDFQFTNLSVEIKTTISRQHEKILITGERQLDSRTVSKLLLVHFALVSGISGDVNLPELVAAVREELVSDPFSRDKFDDLLRDDGYLDIHAPRYEQVRYSVQKTNIFEVRDGFPRLISADIPPGVGDLTYTIVVAQCLPFVLAPDKARELILGTIHK